MKALRKREKKYVFCEFVFHDCALKMSYDNTDSEGNGQHL